MDYGYFSEDSREYVITEMYTPRPWFNYLSNDGYCVITSQTGMGFSFYRAMHAFRVTFHVDDGYTPRFPVTGRIVYARDRDSHKCWAVNPQHNEKGVKKFSCRHGLGYTIISSRRGDIQGEVRFFVPVEDPVEFWTVRLTNRGKKKKRLSLMPYVEWFFSSYPASFCDPYVHARATWYDDFEVLHAVNTNPANIVRYGGFMCADRKVKGFETSKDTFLGPYGSLLYPDGVKTGELRGTLADAEKMVGALRVDVDLSPGRSTEVEFLLGVAFTEDEVRDLREKYRGRANEEFERLRSYWDGKLSVFSVKSPEQAFDREVNVWGKYQLTNTARWTRGLDRGYRDILQDHRGYLPLGPEKVKDYFLRTLAHQNADGTAMRQWSEVGGPHDLRNYKDSPSWIPDLLVAYIKETGDVDVLKRDVVFFDGGVGTVYEHALAAVETLWRERGQKGLCLMGHGDWNDALNAIGRKGKGVSVWLSCAFVHAMMLMEELARYIGDPETARVMQERARIMREAINASAWDGEWYTYAFTDGGEPVGSRESAEGNIHLNVQSWSVFSGVAAGERLQKVLRTIDERLDTEVGPVLIAPAYTRYDPSVGRITAMNPGTFENGSVYTHGACFKMYADCFLGRGTKAVETFLKILPTNPANPPERSTVEPYGITNFYCGPQNPTFGRALYSWFTASPAWLLRTATENIVGVKPDFEGLRIDPCVPSTWRELRMRRLFRGAWYDVSIRNPEGVEKGVRHISVDGRKLDGALLPAFGSGEHKVEVVMGKG